MAQADLRNTDSYNPCLRCLLPCIANNVAEELARREQGKDGVPAHLQHDDTIGELIHDSVEAKDAAEGKLLKVEPPFREHSRLSEKKYKDIVDAPTPKERAFTPRTGWPTGITYAGGTPPDLMACARQPPALFMPEACALGTLFVELLETDDLPDKDVGFIDENDVYALVLFEDTAACTATINDVTSPRWHVDCARAFAFPVYAPYSSLHVALFDSDESTMVNRVDQTVQGLIDGVQGLSQKVKSSVSRKGAKRQLAIDQCAVADASAMDMPLDDDDQIGRVVVELRTLRPGVLYDSWFELRGHGVLNDAGTKGAIRIRYSVTWDAGPRARLAAYLSPPPAFVVPLPQRYRDPAQFALYGQNDEGFDFYVLLDHAYELKDGLKDGVYALIGGVTALLFYESPLISLVACLLWQATCSYPRLLPSWGALALLNLLASTHKDARAEHTGIHAFPSFWMQLSAILLPAWSVPSSAWSGSQVAPTTPPSEAITQKQLVQRRLDEKAAAAKEAEEGKGRAAALQKALEGTAVDALLSNVTKAAGNVSDLGGAVGGSLLTDAQTTLDDVGDRLKKGEVITAGASALTATAGVGMGLVSTTAKVGVSALRSAVKGGTEAVSGASSKVTDPLQLLEPFLGSTQVRLRGYSSYIRSIRGLFTWADPALTTWITLILAVLALVLPLLPWLIILRALGALALGPHMLFVGAYLSKGETPETPDELASRFDAISDPAERRLLIQAEHERRQKVAREKAEAEAAVKRKLPLGAYAEARRMRAEQQQKGGQSGCVQALEMAPSRAGHRKNACLPDPSRSSSVPL